MNYNDNENYVNFSIVFAAKSNNPTVLNPDFLKYNDIVDSSLALKQPPICTEQVSQVVYQNNLSITSQLDKVVFSMDEPHKNKGFQFAYEVSKKYLKCIPHANYIGIGINPQYILVLDKNSSAYEYIISNFMNSKIVNKDLSSIDFSFSFSKDESTSCSIKISSGKKLMEDKTIHNAIMIQANLHHKVNSATSIKINNMNEILDSYKNDVIYFDKEIISKYF